MLGAVHTVFGERCVLVTMNNSLSLPSTAGTNLNKYYAVSFQTAVK